MVGWNSSMPDDEVTPIMHPVRMELAPHARLGRRMAASTAIFVLLTFHCSMIAVGVLNMNANCSEMLWMFLVIYGGVGLLFVYLLFREWLYYARLASLPSLFNLILLIIFYSCLTTAGGFLAVRCARRTADAHARAALRALPTARGRRAKKTRRCGARRISGARTAPRIYALAHPGSPVPVRWSPPLLGSTTRRSHKTAAAPRRRSSTAGARPPCCFSPS